MPKHLRDIQVKSSKKPVLAQDTGLRSNEITSSNLPITLTKQIILAPFSPSSWAVLSLIALNYNYLLLWLFLPLFYLVTAKLSLKFRITSPHFLAHTFIFKTLFFTGALYLISESVALLLPGNSFFLSLVLSGAIIAASVYYNLQAKLSIIFYLLASSYLVSLFLVPIPWSLVSRHFFPSFSILGLEYIGAIMALMGTSLVFNERPMPKKDQLLSIYSLTILIGITILTSRYLASLSPALSFTNLTVERLVPILQPFSGDMASWLIVLLITSGILSSLPATLPSRDKSHFPLLILITLFFLITLHSLGLGSLQTLYAIAILHGLMFSLVLGNNFYLFLRSQKNR